MTTRRDFLKTSAAIAAAATLFQQEALGFATAIAAKPKVIILGAGFAGLAAGYALTQKGYDVTILEARKRISGRVFSYQVDEKEKLTVELGAEWVGASHERLIALCKEFGLELQNNQFKSHLTYKGEYFTPDRWSYSKEWEQTFEKIIADYKGYTDKQKQKLDKTDWWRFLMNKGITERDLDIRELADSTDFGETIRSVSGYAALAEYAESSPNNEMDFKIKGGNAVMAEKLADKIGRDKIKLSHEVVSVTQSGGKVKLQVKVGDKSFMQMECDKIICAIPTFAVSRIKWTPGLPVDKLEAIDALQYARINKTTLVFDQKPWKTEDFDMITDTYGHYFYNSTKNQSATKGALCAYICGDKADIIGRQNDAFKKQVVLDSLKPAFGDVSKLVSKQTGYYWGTDQYSKGAYALYGKGQWYTIMPILKKKFLNVSFAGEHLADWQGFMEGAVNTGEEAAGEIMG